MTQIIITPSEIEKPLFEGPLFQARGDVSKTASEKGSEPEIESTSELRPVVTIGHPHWWDMVQLAKKRGESLPAELSLLLHESKFYLVQLACSFQPKRNSHIEWARLNVLLQPKTGKEEPIAFDLYPQNIYNEKDVNLKIGVAPSLKFGKIEGTLGEVLTTIELKKLEPIVVCFGAMESSPCWDFKQHDAYPLQGIKWCYLIVKKPLQTTAVILTIEIHAEVKTHRGWFRARITEEENQNLTQIICDS